MVEYVYKRSDNRKKALFLAIPVMVVLILILMYGQIDTSVPKGKSACLEEVAKWCNECFYGNNQDFVSWSVSGTQIGEALSSCSNRYLNTSWIPEQDCTGDIIDFCMMFIQE